MSKLDKIIKIITKVIELLDEPSTKDEPSTINKLLDEDKVKFCESFNNKLNQMENKALNQYNQPERSCDHYVKWFAALETIKEIRRELSTLIELYIGKEDDESDYD